MFLNPFMLFGAAAIGVPIIIHLLNKRKFDRVQWAAMRFIQASVEQNQRRLELEDIILLILRCLVLLFLALALARPTLKSAAGFLGAGSGVEAVVVVDNSYSMGASDGVHTRFELAKKVADEVIDLLPTGSSTAVILASDGPDGIIPEPTFDLNLARNVIKEAPLSGRATDLHTSLRRAVEILQRKPAVRREIYLITDGQASGFRQMGNIRTLLEETKTDIKTTVIFARTKLDQNVGVTSLRMSAGLCVVGQPARFDVTVKNTGVVEAQNVRAVLSIDGGEPVDEAVVDTIAPGQSKSLTMFAKMREAGTHAVTVSLTPDRLSPDDSRSVAVRAVSSVKVLLVDGDMGTRASESETFFLRNALQPVPASELENYHVKATVIASADLPNARLDDFDAVYLCNVPDIAPKTVEALADYVKRGYGLVIFPGDRILPQFYNDELHRKLQLLPSPFGDARGDEKNQEQGFHLKGTGLTHSIATLWTDPEAGNLSAPKIYKAFTLTEDRVSGKTNPGPGTRNPGPDAPVVVLRFSDETPFMMERTYGRGRVIQFASTADTQWTELPVRPGLFVPLMHRALGTLVARQDEALTVAVGQPFAYRVGADVLGRDVIFTPPGVKPERAAGKVEMVDGVPMLQYAATNLGGAYDAQIGSDAEAVHVRFAAQSDPAESDLNEIGPEQLEELAKGATVVNYPEPNLEAMLAKSRLGTELWLPLAILAVVCAIAETFLADWFSRPR
jgi:hypothetical protein